MSEQLMKKKSSWKYNSVLFVLVLILLASIVFVFKTETASKNEIANNITEELKTDISVSLKIINEEENIYELNNISSELTVFDITKENTDLEYNNNYDFGVFIESVNGIKNGDEGMYWQYYINDKLGDVAADKKNLEDEDVVEWRFEDVSSFN
ncbi:MAG: DUF4430 domain-containing protein [Candidatus Pacebacteria bacterium]|nr:DUF4430 domain-containing protein [Candidatus Paceibacterota bacterium]